MAISFKKQLEQLKINEPLEYSNVMLAAKVFIDRKHRLKHPDGDFDSAKRWYPDASEECDCCSGIRTPSRSYPFSLMVHCRSAEHVANLYDVEAGLLKAAAKTL